MSLTDKNIEEFRAIYKKHFGKEISRDEAFDSATRLVNLLRVIYKPITKEELEKYSK